MQKTERGASTLLIFIGIIGILIFLAAVAFGALLLNSAKTDVSKYAKMVALYGGGYLPDPVEARDQAVRFFSILIKEHENVDMTLASNPLKAGERWGIKIYFTSAAGDMIPYNGDRSEEAYDCDSAGATGGFTDGAGAASTCFAGGWLNNSQSVFQPSSSVTSAGSGSSIFPTVALPIKSMTVKIYHRFFPWTFLVSLKDFTGEGSSSYYDAQSQTTPGTGGIMMTAQATTQIIPADVVLAVENSASLMSPLPAAKASTLPWVFGAGMGASTLRNTYRNTFYPLGLDVCRMATADAISSGIPPATVTLPGGGATYSVFPSTSEPYGYRGGATSSSDVVCWNLAYAYTRQCFGEVAFNIKSAAVMMYDLLSAVGTFRVGVVHPQSKGEQGHIAVRLTDHPYPVGQNGKELNSTNVNFGPPDGGVFPGTEKYLDGYGISVDPNSGAGIDPKIIPVFLDQSDTSYDFPMTRCAALTREGDFPVPYHPLMKYFLTNPSAVPSSAGGDLDYQRFFTRDMSRPALTSQCNLDPGICLGMVSADQYGLKRFRFSETSSPPLNARFPSGSSGQATSSFDVQEISPRDIIWLKNSGSITSSGEPEESSLYTSMQFAVLRGMEMLKNVSMRRDEQAVRRKGIFVFTDGYDYMNFWSLRDNYALNTPRMTLRNSDGNGSGTIRCGSDEVSRLWCLSPTGGGPYGAEEQCAELESNVDAHSADEYMTQGHDNPALSKYNYNINSQSDHDWTSFCPEDKPEIEILAQNNLLLAGLIYGFAGRHEQGNFGPFYPAGDPFPHDPVQKKLFFHEFGATPLNSIEAGLRQNLYEICGGGRTSLRRGRVLYEHSPVNPAKQFSVQPSKNTADYWRILVPQAAKSLFVAELVG